MKKILYILLCLVVLASCSSVGGSKSKYKKPTKPATKQKKEEETSKKAKTKPLDSQVLKSNGDTTVIIITDYTFPTIKKTTTSRELKEAIEDFEAGNYKSSCPKFKELLSSFPQGDTLYFETMFYQAECLLARDEYVACSMLLKRMLDEEILPPNIHQRVLVRLGQVYCVLNKKSQAEELFNRLKNEYPNSIYRKLANCKAIE